MTDQHILVYMVLNGKGVLLTGSGLHETCFCNFIRSYVCSCCKSFVCLFALLFLCIIVEQWSRKRDYIKCKLIGGGSPRHLNTFCK